MREQDLVEPRHVAAFFIRHLPTLTPPPLVIPTLLLLSFRPSPFVISTNGRNLPTIYYYVHLSCPLTLSPPVIPTLPLCHFDHREKSSDNKLLCPPTHAHPSSSCHFNHPLLSFRPSGEIFRQQTIMSTSPVISPLPPLSFRPSLLVISTNGRNL